MRYFDPRTNHNFRLPMLHIRLVQGGRSLTTVGLVDSGATTTFIPTDMADILGFDLSGTPKDAVGAGGAFGNIPTELERLVLIKGRNSIYDEFQHIKVQIPVNPQAIPYVVLGRDSLFKRYDITFEERNEKVVLKRHRP